VAETVATTTVAVATTTTTTTAGKQIISESEIKMPHKCLCCRAENG